METNTSVTPSSEKLLLSFHQRHRLLDKLSRIVTERLVNRNQTAVDWPAAVTRHRDRILNPGNDAEFEVAVLRLLSELNASHVGFFHESLSRATSKMVLSATYMAHQTAAGERWNFQNVHPGGPAAVAGVRPGDILLRIDGRDVRPPHNPVFAANATVRLDVLTTGLKEEIRTIHIPPAKRLRGQLPQVYPSPIVSYKRIRNDTGYIRIAIYPGSIGIDVANEISLAVKNLGAVDRLILDLRGNSGGGMGVLRAMSLLTPFCLPVGRYAQGRITRVNGSMGYHFELDRIPSKKRELIPLGLKYYSIVGLRKAIELDTPILIRTEGLGPMPFHGRVVLLVDRHTASANEMLIAFAREHGLAKIVGEPTPGRVLGGGKFSLSRGYWLVLPIGHYESEDGGVIEGNPIEPDVWEPFDPEMARTGVDTQMDRALEVVLAL